MDELDLRAEAQLDPAIDPRAAPVRLHSPPEVVFLTGATGFLGSFLLHELLERTSAVVHCLVRARDAEHGVGRIVESLTGRGLWDERYRARLAGVPGDLALPSLGMSARALDQIAEEADLIYHAGALVNFMYGYAYLRPANVEGTVEVLRLAVTRRVKAMHHVSTWGVLRGAPAAGRAPVREDEDIDQFRSHRQGYAQTKWVAEKLVRLAAARGLPACVLRPAYISGHSVTGVASIADARLRMLQTCLRLGLAPLSESPYDMAPADIVARNMISILLGPEALGRTFHIYNPHTITWTELIRWASGRGYDVRLIPFDDWERVVKNPEADHPTDGHGGKERRLRTLTPPIRGFLGLRGTSLWLREQPLRLDCRNALSTLGESGDYPAIDDALLEVYFGHLVRIGFLEPPDGLAAR